MPYYLCDMSGLKLPGSITLSGTASAILNPSVVKKTSTNPTVYTIGDCTIPTFGYHYADVTSGTIDSKSGNNIDISGKNNFVFNIGRVNVSFWYIHHNGSDEYPYGSATATWTIVLHN
ncbi:MAG: hypothetical protein HDR21_00900 [Lachnospiraceae bacterium]|nr:hypothetical protein [Lachnospiraceae bacterium]